MVFKAALALALTAVSTVLAQGVQTNEQGGIYVYPIGGSVNGETGGSLSYNPTVANADLTVRGSDWLWAAFAIMIASGIGVLAWALTLPGTLFSRPLQTGRSLKLIMVVL